MKSSYSLALILSASFALAACSSTPKTDMTSDKQAASSTQSASNAADAQMPVEGLVLPTQMDAVNAQIKARSVYFDYDNFLIKSEYQPVLDMHGKYLARNSKLSIRVEGNADERGSAEYNLALGQKRAEAVVKALKVYGVDASQMEAVSWGKEKPKAVGHDEAAYAQNRRVDLAYPAK